MKQARLDSFLLFVIGCAIFVGVGVLYARSSLVSQVDFKCLYYGSRCFLQHSDPYRQSDLLRVYQAAAADHPSDTAAIQRIVALYVNLPSALVFAAPFAMLPWGPAHWLWMSFTAVCFIFATYMMWRDGVRTAPRISGLLIFLFLCGSELLVEVGNDAGIAVALCVIAAWCFLEDRFVWAGTLSFALSLLLKPHVTGPILLYFLLSNQKNRKYALRTVAVTLLFGAAAVLWVYHVVPHWSSELHANLREIAAVNGVNDPGPAAMDTPAHGARMVSLQTVFSLLNGEPHFYNLASYIVCAPLLIIWTVTTIRTGFSKGSAWLAIADIAVLSMLPLYHRQHDTRLLLLLVPAMATLWAYGGIIAKIGFWLTSACALLTGDVVCEFLAETANRLGLPAHGLPDHLLNLGMTRPAPLILLATGAFYLWAYVRHARQSQPV